MFFVSSRWLSGSALLLLLLVSGCVPFPHTVEIGPEFLGNLRNDGEPVVGATILYQVRKIPDDVDCGPSALSTVTDDFGNFSFVTPKDFRLIVLPGDEVFGWSLCAMYLGDRHLLWRHADFGAVDGPFEISCDLNTDIHPVRQGLSGNSRCVIKYCGNEECREIV